MSYVPFMQFGKTRNCKLVTYTNGELDTIPKTTWDKEFYVERAEDEYAFLDKTFSKGTIRVVTKHEWHLAEFRS
jgi:hypothetical protein